MADTPRRSLARRTTAKDIPVAEAKKRVLELIAKGAKVREACQAVGRAEETYRDWQKTDENFKAELASIRQARATADALGKQTVPDFATFCRDYLHEPLFLHQMRALDVLEGREPRSPHPAIVYERGDRNRVLMNFPPNHAKTTSFSINYAVWRIHRDPNVKIAIISKSQGYAKKILAAIKMRLTNNAYQAMHLAFAPDGGWRDPDQSWSATQIYVQGKGDGEKDPTVEAVGLGGQIYGGRFDVIICDDVIDNENAHRYDDHVDWLMTILDSRLPPDGGLMLVLGTRIASIDLYGELRKRTNENDEQFFTYLAQPAVLDYGDGPPDSWVTLWPWTNGGEDREGAELRCASCYAPGGVDCCAEPRPEWLIPRWTGPRLAKKRFPLGERRWSLVWQQNQIPDDATFKQWAVEYSVNKMRQPGPMRPGAMGHRKDGMSGLYVVGGLDPATVGHTAMIVAGLDRATGKRYLLDGYNHSGTSPATLRGMVKQFTDQYKINEWVIERNAFQKFLTDDPELKAFLQSRGSKLTAHFTNQRKVDPDYGVMSLAPLFESNGELPSHGGNGMRKTQDKGLIELPDDRQSAWVSDLVKQLITWEPRGMSQVTKTDLVMALWFTDIAFKRILERSRDIGTHYANPFLSPARDKQRLVVNLAEYREALLAEKEAL